MLNIEAPFFLHQREKKMIFFALVCIQGYVETQPSLPSFLHLVPYSVSRGGWLKGNRTIRGEKV